MGNGTKSLSIANKAPRRSAAQLVECLCGMQETLVSILTPSTAEHQVGFKVTQKVRLRSASLECIKPYLKEEEEVEAAVVGPLVQDLVNE